MIFFLLHGFCGTISLSTFFANTWTNEAFAANALVLHTTWKMGDSEKPIQTHQTMHLWIKLFQLSIEILATEMVSCTENTIALFLFLCDLSCHVQDSAEKLKKQILNNCFVAVDGTNFHVAC